MATHALPLNGWKCQYKGLFSTLQFDKKYLTFQLSDLHRMRNHAGEGGRGVGRILLTDKRKGKITRPGQSRLG